MPSVTPSSSKSFPGGASGQFCSTERCADLVERPPVACLCGAGQCAFGAATAGEDDCDEVEVAGQGVAKSLLSFLDLFGQRQIRVEEPGHRKQGPQAQTRERGDGDISGGEGDDDQVGESKPGHGAEQFFVCVTLERFVQGCGAVLAIRRGRRS